MVKKVNPLLLIILSFLAVISIGTLLLMLPISTKNEPAGLLDALFTAASATTVTGLVVRDTATYWSGFGKAVILLLIQIGGLGYMTIMSFLAVIAGKMSLGSGVLEAIECRTSLNTRRRNGLGQDPYCVSILHRERVSPFLLQLLALSRFFPFFHAFTWAKIMTSCR